MTKEIKPLFLVAVCALLASCQNGATPPEARTSPPATATEVFHLRGECVALGRKIQAEQLYPATMASHYNPETNRCYVELIVNAEDFQVNHDLRDGQTGELLASAYWTIGNSARRSGVVTGETLTLPREDAAAFKAAEAFIAKMMGEDRQKN